MVDLSGQYRRLKSGIDKAISETIESAAFINGPQVGAFESSLKEYLDVKHVIPCANGTDALQIALMSMGLNPGDEVIVPSFTYVATAEVIGLLRLIPVLVDVDAGSFNVTAGNIEKAITPKTKAIVPVHLFGQSCDMEPILRLAERYNVRVIEDNAQSIGAVYTFSDERKQYTGTIGDIGCLSFFPSKNLGAYGDGGAMITNNDELAGKLRMIANHGQEKKYHHKVIGCNSRLDSIQAAILNVKLKHLDAFAKARQAVAGRYGAAFEGMEGLTVPDESVFSTHVYHQYTLKIKDGKRDALKAWLERNDIPSTVYYPLPLQEQEAFRFIARIGEKPETSKTLSECVLSLPIHTEMQPDQQEYIIEKVKEFFK